MTSHAGAPTGHHSDWLRLVQLTAWSLLLSVFVAAIVNGHGQALDATRALAATEQITTAGRLGVGVLAAGLCTVVIWRTGRQMQLVADGHGPGIEPGAMETPGRRSSLFNRHYPRVLACLPPASLAWQYGWLSAEVWGPLGDARFLTTPWVFRVLINVLGAMIAWLLIWAGLRMVRSRWKGENRLAPVVFMTSWWMLLIPTASGMPAVGYWLGLTPALSRVDFALILAGHAMMAWVMVVGFYWFAERRRKLLEAGGETWDTKWKLVRKLEPVFGRIRESRLLVIVMVAALIVLLVVGVVWPQVGALAGPIAVIYIALAIWVGIGNGVILLGTRIKAPYLRGVPIWSTFVVLVIVANLLFNYGVNAVRTEPAGAGIGAGYVEVEVPEGPVLIVAAEGGGIYAAYHAAVFLAGMEAYTVEQGMTPFSERIYAVSGVSGGSVGLGVFAAALAAGRDGAFREEPGDVLANVKRVLSKDFLSPLLTGLFGRNLLPIFDPWADRTRALEESLVGAWEGVVDAERAHRDALWGSIPELARGAGFGIMLNTTRVGDGRQYHIASFELGDAGTALHPELRLADEGRYLPAATALFVSARFPYVTPTARIEIERSTGAELGFFADGGYYENMGVAGALAIARDVRSRFPDRAIKFLQLRAIEADTDGELARGGEPVQGGELLKPLTAIVNTRAAHSEQIRAQLEELVGAGNCMELAITLESEEGLRVPLGWVLSDETRGFIDAQVLHLERFEAVLEWLGRTP